MTDYINPLKESKEAFLEREAIEISREEFADFSFPCLETVPLCLVHNPGFTACVVTYTAVEAEYYCLPDGRPKQYFLIERSKLDSSVIRNLGEG
jgi:hypothetical protein